MTQLQAAIVAVAQSYIGIKETSRNSGPEIDGWLHLVHLEPGEPWCAAFASACVLEAADECAQPVTFHASGGTQRLWAANMPLQVQDPQPGDLYVLRHTASTGHVGVVTELAPDGTVLWEVSGNTFNDKGGREGDCVAEHTGPPEKTHGGVLLGYLRAG